MAANAAPAHEAARALLATIEADPTAAIDPEVARALAVAVLATPEPKLAYGVEFMAEDWQNWVDEKVSAMSSKTTAEAFVLRDGAPCRVVSRVEYESGEWTPTGYSPKAAADDTTAQ